MNTQEIYKGIKVDIPEIKSGLGNKTDRAYVEDKLSQITIKLNEKANKEEVRKDTTVIPINVSEFDSETKKLLTGGSVAVVGENSTGATEVKQNAINTYHILTRNALEKVNIFNMNNVIRGGAWDNNGVWQTSAAILTTEKTPILPSTLYNCSKQRDRGWTTFWDANKNFISGLTTDTTFYTPSNARYVAKVIYDNTILSQFEIYTIQNSKFEEPLLQLKQSNVEPYEKIIDEYNIVETAYCDDLKTLSNKYLYGLTYTQIEQAYNNYCISIGSFYNEFNLSGNYECEVTLKVTPTIDTNGYIGMGLGSILYESGETSPTQWGSDSINSKDLLANKENIFTFKATKNFDASTKYFYFGLWTKNNFGTKISYKIIGTVKINGITYELKASNFGVYKAGTVSGFSFNETYVYPRKIVTPEAIRSLSGTSGSNPLSSILNGKKWCVLGDSISANTDSWHKYSNNYLSTTITNLAVAGSKIVPFDNLVGSSVYDRVFNGDVPTDTDLITIFAGTNDYGHNVPLGTLNDTANTTLLGSYKLLIEKLLTDRPNARIVLMTPMKRNYANSGKPNYGIGNNGATVPYSLSDLRNKIKELGDIYSIPVLDLYSLSGINLINVMNLTMDGIHPKTQWHTEVGSMIANFILQNYI